MAERTTLHILDTDKGRRTLLARLVFAAGHHAEIYSSAEDFLLQSSDGGLILAHDKPAGEGAGLLIANLARANKWRPVIAFAEQPDTRAVVRTVKAGAFEYIKLPDQIASLNEIVALALREAEKHRAQHARSANAHWRITRLSPREREVLQRLAAGNSNKTIARDLGLSPRTVELHRMKMMGKLGARHAVEAVQIWIEAEVLDAA